MKHVLRISLAIVALIGIISCEQSAQIDSLASGQGSGGPSGGTGLEDAIIGTYNSQTETSTLIHSQAEWADAFQTAVAQELDLVATLDTVYIQDDFVSGEDTVVVAMEGDAVSLEIGVVKANGSYILLDFLKRKCTPSGKCDGCRFFARGCPCKDDNLPDCKVESEGNLSDLIGIAVGIWLALRE